MKSNEEKSTRKINIKVKLFFYFFIISLLTIGIITYFSVVSISSKLVAEEKKSLAVSARKAERFFYDSLAEMTKSAVILSELKEVLENLNNPQELAYVLESKEMLFQSMNVRILNINARVIAEYMSTETSCYASKDLSKQPIMAKGNVGMIRGAGIFSIKNKLCMVSVVPIVDQDSFGLIGYIFLEFPISSEFADLLKEKVKEEVFVKRGGVFLASTYIGKEGERLFPDINLKEKVVEGKMEGRLFFFTSFPIRGYFGKNIGEVIIGRDETPLKSAQKLASIRIVLSSLFVFFIAGFLAIFFGKRLSIPISELTAGAQEWSRGNLDYKVEVKTKDELGILATVFNRMVSSIKTQQKDLEDLKKFFEAIVEGNPIGIIVCDEIGHIRTVNKAAEEILGKKRETIEGKDVFSIIKGLDALKEPFMKVFIQKKAHQVKELPVITVNGEEKILGVLLYPVEFESGETIVLQIEDITKRRELEVELLHLRKLASLGIDMGRIAHEINNILTSLLGHLSVLKMSLKRTPLESKVRTIEEIARKASTIARDTLTFSRKEELKNEEINVRELLDGIEKMLKKILPENITFERVCYPGSLRIFGNPGKVSLAIYNLLINARDAIEDAGRRRGVIRLETAREYVSDYGRNFVKIIVSDNGKGIDKSIEDKIFERYFTTKKKGTGLGLSLVREVVQEMEGIILMESEPGKGATFTILLPEYEGERQESFVVIEGETNWKGERILVIDDERDIVEFLKEFLEMHNYQVVGMTDYKSAEEFIKKEGENLRIAIIDFTLGGKTGKELAEMLKKINPDIRIIMTSGFEEIGKEEGFLFLKKPFYPEDVLDMIANALS